MAAGLRRHGEWAVVTGASSGIGREIALRLAAARISLVLTGRSEAALRDVAAQATAHGVRTMVLPLDLADPRAPGEIEQSTAGLDAGILINSAGFGSGGNLVHSSLDAELAMIDVNCRALLELTHRFGQRFVRQKRGAIVMLSSIVAFQGVPRSANYAATKAYVQSLGEALAREFAGTGVRVLTAIPGPTVSGFAARAGMRLGAADSAAEVAGDVMAALASGRSRVVPGRTGKLLLYSLMTAPRRLRIRIMERIMGSMTLSSAREGKQ